MRMFIVAKIIVLSNVDLAEKYYYRMKQLNDIVSFHCNCPLSIALHSKDKQE